MSHIDFFYRDDTACGRNRILFIIIIFATFYWLAVNRNFGPEIKFLTKYIFCRSRRDESIGDTASEFYYLEHLKKFKFETRGSFFNIFFKF